MKDKEKQQRLEKLMKAKSDYSLFEIQKA